MCAHLSQGSSLTHTHTSAAQAEPLREFKANIYIPRLLYIYAGLPAPLSIFGKLLLVNSC